MVPGVGCVWCVVWGCVRYLVPGVWCATWFGGCEYKPKGVQSGRKENKRWIVKENKEGAYLIFYLK